MGEPADVGVQAVGPDDEVEGAGLTAAEADVDPVGVLAELADGLAEAVVGELAAVLEQDADEVAPQDLHVAAGELGGQLQPGPPALVDEAHRAAAGADPAEVVEHAHALQHGQVGGAAEVHGLAAAAQVRGRLGHRHLEAVPAEPECQRRPGDAGSGDQDLRAHGVHPSIKTVSVGRCLLLCTVDTVLGCGKPDGGREKRWRTNWHGCSGVRRPGPGGAPNPR